MPGAQDISDEELKSIMIGLKQINILKLHDFVSKKQNLISSYSDIDLRIENLDIRLQRIKDLKSKAEWNMQSS
mgnify:CR=1 FL=1